MLDLIVTGYGWVADTWYLTKHYAREEFANTMDFFVGPKEPKTPKSSVYVDVYQDKKKEYRWRVKSTNGRIICASTEGYKTEAGAMKSLKLIRGSIKSAPIK